VKKFASSFQQKVSVKDDNLPEWRLEYDGQIMSRLQRYEVDICMLAGYMLIMGPDICNRYNMINLHPALPMGPKGTWQEVIWELIKEKATESGVMIHLVTTDLDRGPVISFCRYSINGPEFDNLWDEFKDTPVSLIKSKQGENNRLFKSIRQSGFIREVPLIVNTLKSFSEGRIGVNSDKKLFDSSGTTIAGYDLTKAIDMEIEKGLI
jgi:folate-dependent phosphoribosylglycinamide formyltransferase PurN